MKLFTAGLMTESNTFSPFPTSMRGFEDGVLLRPGEHSDGDSEFIAPLLMAARQRIYSKGWKVIAGTSAFSQPGGITVRQVYESLRDEILEQLPK